MAPEHPRYYPRRPFRWRRGQKRERAIGSPLVVVLNYSPYVPSSTDTIAWNSLWFVSPVDPSIETCAWSGKFRSGSRFWRSESRREMSSGDKKPDHDSWQDKERATRAWRVLLFGLVGATATTFVVWSLSLALRFHGSFVSLGIPVLVSDLVFWFSGSVWLSVTLELGLVESIIQSKMRLLFGSWQCPFSFTDTCWRFPLIVTSALVSLDGF